MIPNPHGGATLYILPGILKGISMNVDVCRSSTDRCESGHRLQFHMLESLTLHVLAPTYYLYNMYYLASSYFMYN